MRAQSFIKRGMMAGFALALALQAAGGVAVAAPTSADTARLQAKINSLALRLASTARTSGDRSPKVDVNTLRSQIESALISVITADAADTPTAIAALRQALGAPNLKAVERDAIRELLEKLLRSSSLAPAGLGLGVNLVPAPLGAFGGGSGYRNQ
jgi:hypothetical protein